MLAAWSGLAEKKPQNSRACLTRKYRYACQQDIRPSRPGTSPALGGSNIRLQGLESRYTQLLADGLPLYGGQTSWLGLLQIPRTDLGQVEVIKGAASALYGPSGLGGASTLSRADRPTGSRPKRC